MNEPTPSPKEPSTKLTEELVAFFRALPEAARREYELLAELDRKFGEDVHEEQRARRAMP